MEAGYHMGYIGQAKFHLKVYDVGSGALIFTASIVYLLERYIRRKPRAVGLCVCVSLSLSNESNCIIPYHIIGPES